MPASYWHQRYIHLGFILSLFCGEKKNIVPIYLVDEPTDWISVHCDLLLALQEKSPNSNKIQIGIYPLGNFNIHGKILQQSTQQLSRYFSLDQSGLLTDRCSHPSGQTRSWKQKGIIMFHCPPGSAWTHHGKLATLACQPLIGDIYTKSLFWGIN